MKTLISLSIKRPYIPIIILLAIIIFSAFTMRKLNIDTSERSLILQNDKDLDYYDETIEMFVSDNIELIFIRDNNLFSYEKLINIENMINELSQIEGIIKIESLFNVTNIKNVDDFLSLEYFMNYVPEDIKSIEQIKKDALNNPVLVSSLISKDGKAIVIKLYLDDEKIKNDKSFEINIVNDIEKRIKANKNNFDNIFQTGNPHIKKSIFDTIRKDGTIILPIAVLILLLMLMITIRSLHGALMPLITSAISVTATIGFMNIANIPLNLLTFIIPSLIIVIGSTEDIHILSEYFEGLIIMDNRKDIIIYISKKIGTALIITSITTFFGFLSITINRILVLRQFGIAAAFGLLINPIVTFLFFPVYLRFFGPTKKKKENSLSKRIDKLFHKISISISYIITKHNKIVITIFIIITVIFGLFILNVKLEYDMLNNFTKHSTVNKNIDTYQKNLAGINTLFIRVKLNEENTFLNPEKLKEIDKLKIELENIKEIDKVICVSDYIKLLNREINYGNYNKYTIPVSEDLISQYFLLLDPVEVQKYITNDFTEANIIIKHSISSSRELNKLLKKINKILPGYLDPLGTHKLTGFQILTKKTSYSLAIGTIQGILLLTLIIFIIMSVLFLNIKAGLISLFTNCSPVIFCFGLMGIMNIPLNIGSCLVGMIALGLAVDDTIHLMSKYKLDMREFQDNTKGITASIKSELRPVFSTSISLASLFIVLSISSLTNIKNFGILSGSVIIYAFFCDIFLTTTLLSKIQLITLFDILTLKVKKEILDSKLLKGLKLKQVKELILLGGVREAKKDEYIIESGARGDTINIILEGTVEVSVYEAKKDRRIIFAELKEGDVMGELAVLLPVTRSADIIAKTNVRYFEINNEGLKRIEKMKPKIANKIYYNISTILGDRILNLNKKYLENVDFNLWKGAYSNSRKNKR